MTKHCVIGAIFASVIMTSAGTASHALANTVIVGAPATSENCFPFGCSAQQYGGRYQQLYSTSNFSSALTITGLTFYHLHDSSNGSATDTGQFTFSLSTTNNDLTTNPDANIGSNNTLVYSGSLPTLSGTEFTVNFSQSFAYNPSSGSLLLDIVSSGVQNGTAPTFFDESFGSGAYRYYVNKTNGPSVENSGLVTGFVTGAPVVSPVPLPASAPLFGAALLALGTFGYGVRRRAKATV